MKGFFQRLHPAGGLWVRRTLACGNLPGLLAAAAGILGPLLIGLGAFLPWFLVAAFVPADAPLGGTVRGIEPGITWVFRAGCLIALTALLAATRSPEVRRKHAIRLVAALLLALSLFPAAVLHCSPDSAARAAWLWNQHDQLTGFAGDIYTSQEVRDATWQQRIIVVNEPLDNRIIKLPGWSPAALEWGRFFEVAEWFGLSLWFSQALGRGWALAVVGTILLLLGLGRERALAEPGFLRRSAGRSLAIVAIVLALAALPFFAAGHFLTRARDLVRSGDFVAALAALDRAAAVLPAIREDGVFFLQVGRLESDLGRTTPASDFYRAQRLAEDGFADQAQAAMLAALPTAQPDSVWHRELVKGLIIRAINELNSGQTNPAIALLETVLAADPCNLKANYALQIACLRAGRPDELRLLAARMRQTYRFLNTPTKRAVLAAAEEHLASAELQSGAPAQALAHWQRSKRLPK